MRRDVVAEHRELRNALERLQAVAASVFILPSSPELVEIVRRKLHLEASAAIRLLDRVKPIPAPGETPRPRRVGRGRRVHRIPAAGDVFGERTVVAVLPPSGGRADRRVEWRCSCGETGVAFLFNFRRMSHECLHGDVREARSA